MKIVTLKVQRSGPQCLIRSNISQLIFGSSVPPFRITNFQLCGTFGHLSIPLFAVLFNISFVIRSAGGFIGLF